MKQTFIKSICFALLACSMMQTATAQGIVVNRTDGTKVYYKASEVQSVGVYGYGEGPYDGPELYVEIGGKKWATMNVGATTVAGSYKTCYGDYFAWGETEPRYMTITRTSASEATFTWKNGYGDGYSTKNWPTYKGTTLDAAHDAATVQWGAPWRTPTKEDFEALAMACSGSSENGQKPVELINAITEGGIYWLAATQTYEPEYTGVAGLLFVSKADISKRVFFPAAAGLCGALTSSGNVSSGATTLDNGGTVGYYWSSSINTSDTVEAYSLTFRQYNVDPSYYSNNLYSRRFSGRTIRPVSD